MPKRRRVIISKSGNCQAIPLGPRIFRRVDRENREAFGYSKIVVSGSGELIAVA